MTEHKATFVWESTEEEHYTQEIKTLPVDDFNAAVKLGVKHLALYFTMPEEGNKARNFTNVWEIKNTASLIDYLEWEAKNMPIGKETLARMFSRVASTSAEQFKFNSIASEADAIALLRKEPADTHFLTPSNGGFIKLEPTDRAYDANGRQIWPSLQRVSKTPNKGMQS